MNLVVSQYVFKDFSNIIGRWEKKTPKKQVGKTTRPFRYDLNQIAYDYTAEVGEGNGTPLQYSCLENPTDGGAW